MAFDLRHLRHAAILADTGNFSRAAEVIGITQPALSKSVAALEGEIGFLLFDRTTVGVIPTVMGKQFLIDARSLLVQAAQLSTEAKSLGSGESGTLSLGLGPLLTSLILSDVLVEMAKRFPRLRVIPMAGSAGELLSALSERRIEMCLFAEGPFPPSGITTRKVGSITVGLLTRANHPLAGRKGLRFRDLSDFPMAAGSYGSSSDGFFPPEPTIVCENYHILRETVLNSDTIWLSSLALASGANAGTLIELDVADYPSFCRSILLARSESHTASRAGLEAAKTIESLLAGVSLCQR